MAEKKGTQASERTKIDRARIIVLRKRHSGQGGHHGGAWKVAYADFVTAMMAFFLVMWLVAQNEKVKQNVAEYFSDPATYEAKVKAGRIEGDQNTQTDGSGRRAEDDRTTIQRLLEEAGKEIAEAIRKNPELQEISKNIEIEITNEGLRIQLLEGGDGAFFDTGGAKLTEVGIKAVEAVAQVIGRLKMDVAIEGHTDSRPFGKGAYSNWELSADRANSARKLLETSGVEPSYIKEVRGFADKRLRYPEAPIDERNRRVSIIVFNKLYMQTLEKAVAEPKLLSGDAKAAESPPKSH
jgi:chemotaxis protein MotB